MESLLHQAQFGTPDVLADLVRARGAARLLLDDLAAARSPPDQDPNRGLIMNE